MMNRLCFIGILAILVTGPASFAQDYQLVWSDEFEYDGAPDDAKWDYDIGGGGWGNNELQYYTSRTENVRVGNGVLTIEARLENYGGAKYTSTRIITKNKGDWLYGKIEVKAKLPSGRGTWPAIWMLPTDWEYGDWPRSGEIDIMEHVGYDQGVVHGTVHTEAYNHSIGTQVGDQMEVSDCSDEFHVYWIEWTTDIIDFYIDDSKYFTFMKVAQDYTKWPFDKRFHLLMNIAVGGSWGGIYGVDDSIFPQTLQIDYVRVYQRLPAGVSDDLVRRTDDDEIMIYPNPAGDIAYLSKSGGFDYAVLYNSLGRKVGMYDSNYSLDKAVELDLAHLAPGIYYISVIDHPHPVEVRKVIKFN